MKVLLINPPENSQAKSSLGLKLPPMGLMYIAAYLEKYGVSVEILDSNIESHTVEWTVHEALKRGPDIVGVTATTITLKNALNIIRGMKQEMPEVVSMIGGPHVTYTPSETLHECPDLDMVVLGEGEVTTQELATVLNDTGRKSNPQKNYRELSGKLSSVKGIAYRDPEDPHKAIFTQPRPVIEDLDSIPFPARHLVPFSKYMVFNKNTPAGMIMTSRGCPFACEYCISSRMAGIKFRGRSADNVVKEIELLHDQYGLKEIEFIDDIFTLNYSRARSVAAKIKERGLDLRWSASSRVNTINMDLLKDLASSGLVAMYFGVESGSQRVLDLMNKRITLNQIRDAFDAARKCNIGTIGSFMFGYPGETLDEMKQTIRFSKELNPDIAQFTILTPYPGTPVYDRLKALNLLRPVKWGDYSFVEPIIDYEPFGYSAESVKSMLLKAYAYYYIRPSYILKHLDNVPIAFNILLDMIKSRFMRGKTG